MLLKTSAYVKIYDGKFMMEKFKPVYNKIFLKTKIKSHGNEVTDFYDKENPKVDSNHACLAVINLDSAIKKNDSCYLLVFLKV